MSMTKKQRNIPISYVRKGKLVYTVPPAEAQVMEDLAALGLSRRQVARALKRSDSTVRKHENAPR